MLYCLAAEQFEESDELYGRSSKASRNSMVSDRPKVIEMAIRDLDDYLTLFPEQVQAREIRDALRASKAERLSAWVIGGAIGAI